LIIIFTASNSTSILVLIFFHFPIGY
jgi:hypothetical protein